MSIMFMINGELDRRLNRVQMRQEAFCFIHGYQSDNIVDAGIVLKGRLDFEETETGAP